MEVSSQPSSSIPLEYEDWIEAGADWVESCGLVAMAVLQKFLSSILQIDCMCYRNSFQPSTLLYNNEHNKFCIF